MFSWMNANSIQFIDKVVNPLKLGFDHQVGSNGYGCSLKSPTATSYLTYAHQKLTWGLSFAFK